jgi:hypothetical protein
VALLVELELLLVLEDKADEEKNIMDSLMMYFIFPFYFIYKKIRVTF